MFFIKKQLRTRFKTWKTIKLGTGLKTRTDFYKALVLVGCKIGNIGPMEIMDSSAFVVAPEEVEIDLVKVSVGQLGFRDDTCYYDMYNRAKELGLALCPSEVGPQLRLQYLDQPKGSELIIGMERIFMKPGHLDIAEIFYISNDEYGLYLYARPVDYEFVTCRRHEVFVFAKTPHR